jgi:hypothetical protein
VRAVDGWSHRTRWYHRRAPTVRSRIRSNTLDDPTSTPPPPPPPSSGSGTPTGRPRSKPPGLRDQIAATRDAALTLVMAHVELAKAEAGAIAGQVGRLAALGALALVLVIFAVFLLVIGVSLAIGEWVLGSMGWGVIDGVLLFLSVAMASVLLGVGISGRRIVRSLAAAVVIGIVVGVVLGLDLLNQLYTAIGDSTALAVEPGVRPLVVGVLLGGLVGLIAGVITAVRMSASGGGRFVAWAGLTVFGVALGAFTAITFSPQVGAGIGITVGYLAWMLLMALDVQRTGIDVEALKNRFTPTQTIETSKETLEWLQKRMPPGIGS